MLEKSDNISTQDVSTRDILYHYPPVATSGGAVMRARDRRRSLGGKCIEINNLRTSCKKMATGNIERLVKLD